MTTATDTPIALSAAALPILQLPLLQYGGARSVPCVSAGDHVIGGAVLATPLDAHASYVIAPTSGVIENVGRAPATMTGTPLAPALRLRPDGEHRQTVHELLAWRGCPFETIVQRIAACAVLGLGGAAFPTAVKLHAAQQAKVHTLLVNAVECEPEVHNDRALLAEHTDAVARGACVLMHALGLARVCVASARPNAPRAQILAAAIRQQQTGHAEVSVATVDGVPAAGYERTLVDLLAGTLGNHLPVLARGYLVQNAHTLFAVARAVDGIPLTQRLITFTTGELNRVAWVAFGTSVADATQALGWRWPRQASYKVGGSLTGIQSRAADLPLGAATIAVALDDDVASERPCINCQLCADACPAHLAPHTLTRLIRHDRIASEEALALQRCFECGACDVVCPSNIPLLDQLRRGKLLLQRRAAQARAADTARARYESQQLRNASVAAAHAARRAERIAGRRIPSAGNDFDGHGGDPE